MNRRNRELVLRLNPRRAICLANDKIATKAALDQIGVPIPATIAEVHTHREVPALFPVLRQQEQGFIAKPSRGAQGRGVMAFSRVLTDEVLLQHGPSWSLQDFVYYVSRILCGEFTVGQPVDSVIIEELLKPDFSWIVPDLPGAPDLRIIVHEGRPILAMTRLPTLASEGKANLHRGGVGVGIDLASGRTTYAIWRERPVSHHPDSGHELTGRHVEGFEDCLKVAADCAKAIPLGYMGVDIIRDRHRGPCVIEVNARPGLAIQLANRTGLETAINAGNG